MQFYTSQTITPIPFQTKISFLYSLHQKYGCNPDLAYNFTTQQGKIFSKWISFLYVLEHHPDEYIPEVKCTRKQFLNKASHRTVMDIEILLDIDEAQPYPSIEEKATAICQSLQEKKIKYRAYFSGSKSYHISILLPQLRLLPQHMMCEYKKKILYQFGADLQKASRRTMIALEGVRHWKTGKPKREVCIWKNFSKPAKTSKQKVEM